MKIRKDDILLILLSLLFASCRVGKAEPVADPMVVRQYTRPAPFTNTLGENAPSMVGTWIGTKIITSYMKHHKKTTLRQLLEMSDYERMFTESRFNP